MQDGVPDSVVLAGPLPIWPDSMGFWAMATEANQPGVYLLTVPVSDSYRILYVGEAGNMADRIRQHIASYLSGEYLMYDGNLLSQGVLKPLWVPSGEVEMTLSKLDEHRSLVVQMLQQVQVFFAVLPATAKRGLQRIESAIIRALRDSDAKNFLENRRLSIGEAPSATPVQIECKSSLFGLPRTISA